MAKSILVIGEVKGASLRKTTLEGLTVARAVAGVTHGEILSALVGSGPDPAAAALATHGFNQTEGKITLAPESASGSIDIAIDTASISTGLADLEKHLRGEDFLDANRFPKIVFKSKQLSFNKDRLISADGELTLHGMTRPVHLTVDHFYCGVNLNSMKNVCGANATAWIKRSDFGVDKYAPALADDVNVMIQIEAIKD